MAWILHIVLQRNYLIHWLYNRKTVDLKNMRITMLQKLFSFFINLTILRQKCLVVPCAQDLYVVAVGKIAHLIKFLHLKRCCVFNIYLANITHPLVRKPIATYTSDFCVTPYERKFFCRLSVYRL